MIMIIYIRSGMLLSINFSCGTRYLMKPSYSRDVYKGVFCTNLATLIIPVGVRYYLELRNARISYSIGCLDITDT